MMQGLAKSDSVVVEKPANNAGAPVAEWVEPRVGTKVGTKASAGSPRTRRTQSRDAKEEVRSGRRWITSTSTRSERRS